MIERKIGIMGGTFDPIHLAHIQLAKCAYEQFHLDEVIFLPAGDPPHKKGKLVTPAYRRLEMVKLAIQDYPHFRVSEYEIEKKGYSYSAETLEYFTQMYPEDQFYFIIGADSLFQLPDWYAPERCLAKAIFLVGNRHSHTAEEIDRQIIAITDQFGGQIETIDMPDMTVSSSSVRDLIANQRDASMYLTPKVLDYIQSNHLYYQGLTDNLTMLVKNRLPGGRFLHTLGVVESARGLAVRYSADIEKAHIAALLHDVAKPMSVEVMTALCRDTDYPVTEDELESPKVIHAKAGAVVAERDFQVADPEILDAIRYHTTGRPGMTTLEKIIFVADFIEPGRNKAPNLDKIRKESMIDLNRCVFMIIRDTLEYLKDIGEHIDIRSVETYNYYKNITNM